MCVSKFPGDANDPSPGTTLWEPLYYSINPLSVESLDDPTALLWLCIMAMYYGYYGYVL